MMTFGSLNGTSSPTAEARRVALVPRYGPEGRN